MFVGSQVRITSEEEHFYPDFIRCGFAVYSENSDSAINSNNVTTAFVLVKKLNNLEGEKIYD